MDSKVQVRVNFTIGEQAEITKTVSEKNLIMFAKVVKDYNPLHFNSDFADKTSFKGRIVHGMLEAKLISALSGNKLPGFGSVYISQNLKFKFPFLVGNILMAEL